MLSIEEREQEDLNMIREYFNVSSPEDRKILDEMKNIYGDLEWLTFNYKRKNARFEKYRLERGLS